MLEKRALNGTDLIASQICLGTNMFGSAVDQATVNTLLDRFAADGGNFIDTARCYGDWVPSVPLGASERSIGTWLKGRRREDFVIATKGGFSTLRNADLGSGKWEMRMTPEHLTSDLTESLEHLGVATIDLYWAHVDDPSKPVEPIVDCLLAHRRAGRIRHFGLSNFSPERVAAVQEYARNQGEQGAVALEPFWSLATPNIEAAAMQGYYAHFENGYRPFLDQGMTIIPYGSQSRGFFAKLEKEGESNMRTDVKAMFLNDSNLRKFDRLKTMAETRGTSVAVLTLAYMTSQPKNVIPIIGVSGLHQLEEALQAAAVKLSPTEMAELRA